MLHISDCLLAAGNIAVLQTALFFFCCCFFVWFFFFVVFFFFFGFLAPVEGSKGQISFNFNYKVNLKEIFTRRMKYTNIYQTGFFILSHGSCPRGWTWGCLRVHNLIPSGGLSVMLSLPKPLSQIKPNLVFELLTCMVRATANSFWPHPLGP